MRPQQYVRGIVLLFPPDRRYRIREVLNEVGHTLQWWILGKSIEMFIIGVATGIGVKLALVLAILAATLSFIPYLGPVLSATPAILIGFLEGPDLAAKVFFLYVGIQFIESNMLTPLIEKKTVLIPPALTIFVQTLSGLLFGLIGVLLASPLTAMSLVLVKKLYIEDFLENRLNEAKENLSDGPNQDQSPARNPVKNQDQKRP